MGSLAGLVFAITLGMVFIIASLPEGTAALALQHHWTWLTIPAEVSAEFKLILPEVPDVLEWISYALVAYVSALLLISLRHHQIVLFGRGIAVALTATFLLHALAWVGVIGFSVGKFIVGITVAITEFFSWLGDAALREVVTPIVGLFAPALGSWAWAGALAATATVLGLAITLGPRWMHATAKVAAWIALALAVLIGLGALLSLVPASFWATLGSIFGTIFSWLLLILAIATTGQLFLDQLASGVHAGSGRLGVTMGAIAIGSTLAVLMLVGNIYGAYDFYPAPVAEWAHNTVLSKEPKFDATVTLAVVSLCTIGVLSNLGRMRQEPDLTKYRRSLIYTIMGMITAVVIAAIDKATDD
ncbi:hypothetical protein [Amycolatopsis magusensis]|uniref:hypothetical protein n=1 Tax=Amycolatopsis magusensis TaxID=882444 RepID=UPI0024A8338C|nr:hypothetical protein [Amycolatopsis magusensis]MDI5975891.1 hypothetical protein [Amycolatopsis magusensis]